MKHKFSATLGTLILAVTAGTIAWAGPSGGHDNDVLVNLARVQVPITQAIATAEQAAGGNATKAGLENKRQGLVYEVEVANSSTRTVMEVRVDATSGAALVSRQDHVERKDRYGHNA